MIIASTTNGLLNFRPDLPPGSGVPKIPGSLALHATEPFGKIYYQKYETADYAFWLSRFSATENHQLHIRRDGPMVGFKLLLEKGIRYSCEGCNLLIKQGQFCFAGIPYLDSLFSIEQGHDYLVFDMMLQVDYIKSIGIDAPILDRFFSRMKEGKTHFLLDSIAQSDALLLDGVYYLLRFPARKQAAAVIIKHLIHAAERWKGPDLPEYKIERMFKARDIIRENLSEHVTNPILAKMVASNARDLKVDFVKVFSMPPGQYLQYERVKEAKRLLMERPDLSIDEIAVLSGFKHTAALDPVFKKNTGTTPTIWRNLHIGR